SCRSLPDALPIYRAGDAVVVERGRLVAEHTVRESLAFADRHRSELDPVRHVADRIDAVDTGLAEAIDLDRAALTQLNAGVLQPETLRVRQAACGVHHAIDFHIVVIGHRNLESAALQLLDAAE